MMISVSAFQRTCLFSVSHSVNSLHTGSFLFKARKQKEFRLKAKIDLNDFTYKANNIVDYAKKGEEVKVTLLRHQILEKQELKSKLQQMQQILKDAAEKNEVSIKVTLHPAGVFVEDLTSS